MTRYVAYLDEFALLEDSRLVELQHRNFELRVTQTVTKALRDPKNSHPNARWAWEHLNAAIDERRVSCTFTDLSGSHILDGVVPPREDLLSQAFLSKRNEPDRSVIVVTTDPQMSRIAAPFGIHIVAPGELRKLVTAAVGSDAEATEQAAAEAARIARRARLVAVGAVISGLLVAASGVLIWTYIDQIVRTVTVWGTLVAVGVIGLLLYALRGRQRLAYGVAEAAIGFLTAAKILLAPTFDIKSAGVSGGLGLLGGLYIMVRGLDNIGKALERTPYETAWRRFSGERSGTAPR